MPTVDSSVSRVCHDQLTVPVCIVNVVRARHACATAPVGYTST